MLCSFLCNSLGISRHNLTRVYMFDLFLCGFVVDQFGDYPLTVHMDPYAPSAAGCFV